jgi:hypothetical protein
MLRRLRDRDIPDMVASIPSEPVTGFQLGEFLVVLEETTLTSVQAAFGGLMGRRAMRAHRFNGSVTNMPKATGFSG